MNHQNIPPLFDMVDVFLGAIRRAIHHAKLFILCALTMVAIGIIGIGIIGLHGQKQTFMVQETTQSIINFPRSFSLTAYAPLQKKVVDFVYYSPAVSFVSFILVLSLIALLMFGIARISLDIVRFEYSSYSNFFIIFSSPLLFIKALFATLIYLTLLGIGLACCYIPGIFVLVRLSFFSFFILDQNTGIFAALSKSFKLTKSFCWQYLGLLLIFYLGFSAVLFILPIHVLARAQLYGANTLTIIPD